MTIPRSPGDCRAVIYGASLGSRGGTGVYLARLLRGLIEAGEDGVMVAAGGRLAGLREALSLPRAGSSGKVVDEMILAPIAASRMKGAPVHMPAFTGCAPPGAASLLTLHDLAFLAHPGWFPPLRRLYYRLVFPRSARSADIVMADSAFTASEAARLMGLDPAKLRVVPLSSGSGGSGDAGRGRRKLTGGGPYILSVSTIEPRKNIPALLDAWKGIAAARPGMTLVVAGRWGWGPAETRRRLCSMPGVLWTGPLGDSDLADAYAGAELLVYPSLYEGFGLPPLEAALEGTPSVLGPADALREVYHDVAAAFCGGSPGSIRDAVLDALESRREPSALRDFARGLSDRAMAGRVAGIYREAGG
ncbi:MAG TPA: glycosyltransferase family 1 protein [Candidatus Fermentibacter sp.]|nr:glycosyltransferase family 1 protein [Candidatus Fermentibacter sp.]